MMLILSKPLYERFMEMQRALEAGEIQPVLEETPACCPECGRPYPDYSAEEE